MQHQKLIRAAIILLILVLTALILKFGKPFLVPLTFAGLFAMLLLPITVWLEKKKIHKAIATFLSVLVLVAFFAAIISFVWWQVSDLAQNTTKIEQQVSEKYQQIREYISTTLGVSEQKQDAMMKKQQESSGGKVSSMVTGIVTGIGSFLTNTLLVLVYIFLLIYFRGHIKRFILRWVKEPDKENAREVIHSAQKVTQKYLTGMALMIIGLWIMYGIGFTIAGVKNALFFAVLCGLLEIVPFVGNLIGNVLTILMSVIQGGDSNVIIGILITYATVQFIQSYILEPLVVGAEVNINPLFTIIGLIAGELVWGIPGMVVAIPILGVTKIICDHIDSLRPIGELIGEDKKEDSGFKKKMKSAGQTVKGLFGR